MRFFCVAMLTVAAVGQSCLPVAATEAVARKPILSTYKVVPASEVEWEQLNPARGDKSPKAGALWGDRKSGGPSGFLVKFADGFSSPPHIHNVTYRGVVVDGLVHNDDPAAASMWMPPGAYWSQPGGEVHITAARGSSNVAYIEIDDGPFLVEPAEEAFDRGERPVNIDPSNLVWLDPTMLSVFVGPEEAPPTDGPRLSILWGTLHRDGLNGSFLRLPEGYRGEMRCNASKLDAVVVQGVLAHKVLGASTAKTLDPGSYFGSTGKTVHSLVCQGRGECSIYIRSAGLYEVASGNPGE